MVFWMSSFFLVRILFLSVIRKYLYTNSCDVFFRIVNDATVIWEAKSKCFLTVYGSSFAAGTDLQVMEEVALNSNAVTAIKTGIKASIPPGWYGQLCVRSFYAKHGFVVCGGVIDEDYHGEISRNLAHPRCLCIE